MGITTDEVMSLQRLPKSMIEALASLAEKADDILALLDTSAEGETGAEGATGEDAEGATGAEGET